MPVLVSEGNPDNLEFEDEYPVALSDSESGEEDYPPIRPDDLLLLAGKIEGEFSSLELYTYDSEKGALMIHHDIMLGNYPVCLEWLCVHPGSIASGSAQKGNFGIVGSLSPEIEIWDLDAFEPEAPFLTFKGKDGHKDAVTSLSVHPVRHNILLSGSADQTVKIWDVEKAKNVFTFKDNSDKVSSVIWDETNESCLISVTMDGVVQHMDARDNKSIRKCSSKGEGEIESAVIFGNNLFLGFESGTIQTIDLNSMKLQANRKIKAHQSAVMGLGVINHGYLASGGNDGYLRLFDLSTMAKVSEIQTKASEILGASVCLDQDNLIAFGSSSGEVVIWDTETAIKGKLVLEDD